MSKWETVKIGTLCDAIFSGGTPKTAEPSYWDGDLLWLSSGETRNRHIFTTDRTITQEGVDNSSTRLALKGDIVMACAGQGNTRGQTSVVMRDMYINQSVIALRANPKKLHNLYLFHSLSSRYDELRAKSDASSTRGSITTDMLKKLPISIPTDDPDLRIQTRIADILSAYDDAIENNNRRIDLLEKAAQELYKEWFVRFRFPGHESARFVNGLPEGWERAKFKGNIAYNTGKLDSNAMTANGEYSFYTCAKQIYATDTFCFDGECVLLGGNNATGDFSLFYANEKLDAYQRTYIVTPLNPLICCPYIFFVLKEYLLTFQITSAGAATKFLTKAMLDRFTILLPTEYVAKEFKLIVQPMFDLRVRLQKQNSNLARQRDLLLPRLMSGKLEV